RAGTWEAGPSQSSSGLAWVWGAIQPAPNVITSTAHSHLPQRAPHPRPISSTAFPRTNCWTLLGELELEPSSATATRSGERSGRPRAIGSKEKRHENTTP